MRTIYARNVNEAYTIGLNALNTEGHLEESRVGPVKVFPTPIGTTYERPWERVLFNEKRNANPFFHLMESLWMLAGRDDVKWIGHYNQSFHKFSDNGKTFHGAYGYRWRKHFNQDQLVGLVNLLNKDPNTRRAVITMWDPYSDFAIDGRDFPCNLSIAFRVRNNKLTMSVFNRSNDLIWGAYGANAVHMSILQEFVASALNLEMGPYTQMSNDLHAYTDVLAEVGIPDPHPMDPYDMGQVQTKPLIQDFKTWHDTLFYFIADVEIFNERDYQPYKFDTKRFSKEPFFLEIAMPMARAWGYHKLKNHKAALSVIDDIMPECDWKLACRKWIMRRIESNATSNAEKRRLRKAVAHDI